MPFAFNIEEVPVVGAKAAGVKAMNLKADDDFNLPLSATLHLLSVDPTWKFETCFY